MSMWCFFVVEAGRYDAKDKAVSGLLPKDRPVILVVNKTDQIKDPQRLLPFGQGLGRL
jgi:GTP-binding protein Era